MSEFSGHAYHRCVAVGVIACFITFTATSAEAARWSDLLYFWSSNHKNPTTDDQPRATFSVGSYFGDSSDTFEAKDTADRFSAVEPGPDLGNLMSRDGGAWAFMTLRTKKLKNVKAFQVGTFRVGGLGAGFDEADTQTIQVASEKVIPGYYSSLCIYVPERRITVTNEQRLTGSSDEATSLGGVEFNVMFKDKIDFAGVSGLETFAGARFLNFGDSYSSAFSNTAGNGTVNTGSSSVTNRLVGTQFGVTGRKFLSKDMLLTGRLAFGVFANFLDEGNEASTIDGQVQRFSNINDSETGFAQMVEFSPTLHVRLEEKVFFSVGGTMMWLNGIKRASENLSGGLAADGSANTETTSYLYYGGKATLKWTFN